MKLIELGSIDYKIIIPLIYPFLYQVRILFHKDEDKPIFMFFTNFCGYLFCGIFYSIIKCRTRRNKSKEIEKVETAYENKPTNLEKTLSEVNVRKISYYNYGENLLRAEANAKKRRRIKSQYLFILLLVFIYLIPMLLDSYISSKRESYFGTSSAFSLLFVIFFIITFSRVILGLKIYSHQIFSSAVILISNIFVIVIIFVEKADFSNYGFFNFALVIIITGFYALFNVLEKKYYNLYMDSPYHFMFMIGLFSSIAILIYEIFTVIIFGYDREFNGIFFKFEKNFSEYGFLYILMFIGDILSAFIWLAGIQLTVYFFTPTHFIISESVSQIITTIIDKAINDFPVVETVIVYFFFVVILFAAFVYNEIIIINVCNLNKDTKKNILIRQLAETEETLLRLRTIENETNEDKFERFNSDGLIDSD